MSEGRKVVHKGRAGFSPDAFREAAARRRAQGKRGGRGGGAGGGAGGGSQVGGERARELTRRSPTEDVRVLKSRLQAFVIVGALIFLGLSIRLFQLQILEGVHFARRAEQNFIDTIDVEAPRGRIFDAKGRPLATNHATYALYVTAIPRVQVPGEERGEEPKIKRVPIDDQQIIDLGALIDFVDEEDRASFVAKLERLRDDERNGRYAVAVRNNLSWEENARIQTRGFDTWVEIRESARRYFPEHELTAFVTGFMREIGREALEDMRYGDYRPGDRVGVTGIERQWENYLRGRLGEHSRVVDALGREVADPPPAATAALPPDVEPIPGQDIYLSLDLDLQRVAATALAGQTISEGQSGEELAIDNIKQAGGVVALEVETGRILAMVSAPAIDPNAWEGRISRAQYEAWLNSPFKPFVDKTVQENYYPGSTYKVVSALAMLEEPNFNPEETIECEGSVEYGGRTFKDTHKHGIVDLEQAIVQSCNVYFYHLAIEKDLTLLRMEEVARRLGLGERTGLGINAEVPGVVPTEASEARQGTFQRGVRLNSAIGQGNVKATVLQLAVLYAALANGGYVVTPSLVDRVVTSDGKLVLETEPKFKSSQPQIQAFDRQRIHKGLIGVVNDSAGTAHSERLEGVMVAGKTGTAQVGIERKEDEEIIEGWDVTKDHAWFASYAPAERPEIAVVALVAHGGIGADAAAPIVMRVIDHYLGSKGREEVARPRAPGVPPPLPGELERQREAEIEDGL